MNNSLNDELLDQLVNLKFLINKTMSSSSEFIRSIEETNIPLYTNDLNILNIIGKYQNKNIKNNDDLLKQQKNLYIDIDKILLKNCDHEWIDDVVEEPLERERNICYCKHCFYYKKK